MPVEAIYTIAGAAAVILILAVHRLFTRKPYRPELIDELEGHDFEEYCAELLRRNGFSDVTVTKGSGDFGLDILCEKDGVTYGEQCNRYDKPIGVHAIQQAYAGR
ncbi:MAG: restriction endonuclease, partial [Lachnospiraceae bacterium]|nr:restriction endonuclease [Lachnospiraceae bacterium]